MDKELIYRDDARRVMLRYSPENAHAIDSIKTANIQIIGDGEWIEAALIYVDCPKVWKCSHCNQTEVLPTKHCPNCGWRNKKRGAIKWLN